MFFLLVLIEFVQILDSQLKAFYLNLQIMSN